MPLTLCDVLSLEVVQRGSPVVVAAADRLDASVRWVHVAEMADVGRLLRGGELVLSTGIALPSAGGELADYVASLAGARVAGLAIELGRRYAGALPGPLVAAAEARGVPLIAFEHEVPFVEITEAVHARIIDAQNAELRAAQQVHAEFTELSVDGAPPEAIVRAASSLSGCPVILTDLSCRVLSAAGFGSAGPGSGLPEDFTPRARAACEGRPRTWYAESEGWLATTVGARGVDWGRLFLCRAHSAQSTPAQSTSAQSTPAQSTPAQSTPAQPPSPLDTVLLERAATTLALGRLLARQAESVERQAHRTLISAIISDDLDQVLAAARARAMGVPVTGRQLVALVARIRETTPGPGAAHPDGLSAHPAGPPPHADGLSAHAAVDATTAAIADACRGSRIPALVSALDDVRAGALLSLPPHADAGATLRQLTAPLDATTAVIGVGSPAADLGEARRSFLDAREVADAAIRSPDGRAFYRLPDLRLRGLLHLLRDDSRVAAFASRELGALLAYDSAHDTSLLADLAVYLEEGGNKAAAAARAHLARPTFYQRLHLIERICGVSLTAPESRTSLHVALLALKPDESPGRY
jgi:purine catabolism regulator